MRIERDVHLHATPEQLWPILSDTDRQNRLLGQREVTYRPNESSALARYSAETRVGFGIVLKYDEMPFEWRAPHQLRVLRRMHGSPLREYAFGFTVAAEGQGSCVHFQLDLEPRFRWATPLVWALGFGFLIKYMRFLRQTDGFLAVDQSPRAGPAAAQHLAAEHPYAKPRSPCHEDELARRTHTLRRLLAEQDEPPVPADLGDRLSAYVRDASDVDASKLRPFDIADSWGAARRDVLAACLHGMHAGLVELRFAVVCPSCRLPSDLVAQLSELGTSGHCPQCDLRFDLDLDRAVEVIFQAHPAVRTLPEQVFCLGSPARSPHVLEQRHFAAGASTALYAPLQQGRYRLFLRGGLTAGIEVRALAEDGAPDGLQLAFDDQCVTPAFVTVTPGSLLRVENRTGSARHGKLERLEYATTAATVHQVSVFAEFRRLCSTQLLKAGTPLKVASVVLLFSDLTGSTALYSEIGDAAAFRVVDDHFDVLRKAVEAEGGVVIKTMGDAIMASFLHVSAAVRAIARCMDDFAAWQSALPFGDRIGLKLGLHDGACYVITANGMLDYFGQTVNVAARLQGLAASGECALTRDLFATIPSALRVGFEERRCTPAARLKGVEGTVDVVHLTRASFPT